MTYRHIYNLLVLPALWTVARLATSFSQKVRAGWDGRKGLVDRVRDFRQRVGERRVVLFHCASAGEIESIKPVAEILARSKVAVALSYFSPSAAAALRDLNGFEFTDYSPFDRVNDVMSYLHELRPDVIAIVKHDVWPNLVWTANDLNIPVLLVNGNFHPRSLKMLPFAQSFHRSVYRAFREILAVSPEDAVRASQIVGRGVTTSAPGDSRYDRVAARAAEKRALPKGLHELCSGRFVLIAGSTHTDDEELLIPALSGLHKRIPKLLTIIVPHDPSEQARSRISSLASRAGLRVFDLDLGGQAEQSELVVVNRSGILADLYCLGKVAFVGGGFGRGVHSVLEPMAFGLPVICGPNIHVSHEAGEARREGLLCVVRGRHQFAEQLACWLEPGQSSDLLHAKVRDFVSRNLGAAERISTRLKEFMRA